MKIICPHATLCPICRPAAVAWHVQPRWYSGCLASELQGRTGRVLVNRETSAAIAERATVATAADSERASANSPQASARGQPSSQDSAPSASQSHISDPEFTRARILVTGKLAGFAIGVKGERIARIYKQTGARFVVSSGKKPLDIKGRRRRVLIISGKVPQITAGLQILFDEDGKKQADERMLGVAPDRARLLFLVPVPACGRLLGPNGSTIKFFADKSGAKLSLADNPIPTSESQDRLLYIQGEPEKITAAVGMVLDRLRELPLYQDIVLRKRIHTEETGAGAA